MFCELYHKQTYIMLELQKCTLATRLAEQDIGIEHCNLGEMDCHFLWPFDSLSSRIVRLDHLQHKAKNLLQ